LAGPRARSGCGADRAHRARRYFALPGMTNVFRPYLRGSRAQV
jgi:hypothetical protein